MTQEEKQLLLKDLCMRLPYGVKVWYPNGSGAISTVKGIVGDVCYFNEEPSHGNFCHIERVKPYLRPMSSMTEEEEDEWWKFANKNTIVETHSYSVDWLNAHHLDYRGLIPMGLGLEAPEGMYDIKHTKSEQEQIEELAKLKKKLSK
ncbi:MAG: hypothetical protein II575_09120 [Bacteroidales bacterium]|nr:hypothetical protein [Bacteroidales bacterium]